MGQGHEDADDEPEDKAGEADEEGEGSKYLEEDPIIEFPGSSPDTHGEGSDDELDEEEVKDQTSPQVSVADWCFHLFL